MTEHTCIDTHCHWVPSSYADVIKERADASAEFRATNPRLLMYLEQPDGPIRNLGLMIERMDSAGIDVAVMSLPPPAAILGDLATSVAAASRANDEMLWAAAQHPGRFDVLLALPMPHVDASLAELERLGRHPDARGVSLMTVNVGWTIDDERFEPIYRLAADLGLPLVTHPSIDPLPEAWQGWTLPIAFGPVISTSLGVARMVLSGMLDRIPQLDIVMPHLGGTLPYVAQRFDDFGPGGAEHVLSHYLRNRLYFDTCSFHPPAFRCAVETVGLDRLMLGSDYPFRNAFAGAISDVMSMLDDPDERAMVLGGTASRWFGARPPVPSSHG